MAILLRIFLNTGHHLSESFIIFHYKQDREENQDENGSEGIFPPCPPCWEAGRAARPPFGMVHEVGDGARSNDVQGI